MKPFRLLFLVCGLLPALWTVLIYSLILIAYFKLGYFPKSSISPDPLHLKLDTLSDTSEIVELISFPCVLIFITLTAIGFRVKEVKESHSKTAWGFILIWFIGVLILKYALPRQLMWALD